MNSKRFKSNKSKKLLRTGDHVPNSNEKKVIRRIMSQTGLSEQEIMDIKKYRIEISDAKKESSLSEYQKIKKRLLKQVTKELKLPKEHPKTFIRYNEVWIDYWKPRMHKWARWFQVFLEENNKTVGFKRFLLTEKTDGKIRKSYIPGIGRGRIRI